MLRIESLSQVLPQLIQITDKFAEVHPVYIRLIGVGIFVCILVGMLIVEYKD